MVVNLTKKIKVRLKLFVLFDAIVPATYYKVHTALIVKLLLSKLMTNVKMYWKAPNNSQSTAFLMRL